MCNFLFISLRLLIKLLCQGLEKSRALQKKLRIFYRKMPKTKAKSTGDILQIFYHTTNYAQIGCSDTHLGGVAFCFSFPFFCGSCSTMFTNGSAYSIMRHCALFKSSLHMHTLTYTTNKSKQTCVFNSRLEEVITDFLAELL